MYVGAASQHLLRMSFVPKQEAKIFDTEVTTFWSQFIQRDALTVILFATQAWETRYWLSCPAARCGTMARLAIGHPNTHGDHSVPSPRHHDCEPNLFNSKPRSHYR